MTDCQPDSDAVTVYVRSSGGSNFTFFGDDVATVTGDGVVFTLRRRLNVEENGGTWTGDTGGQIRFSVVQ